MRTKFRFGIFLVLAISLLCACSQKIDVMYNGKIYSTIQSAIDDIEYTPDDGKQYVVTLYHDLSENSITLPVCDSGDVLVTIDLNGHKLTLGDGGINVGKGCNFTLTSSSSEDSEYAELSSAGTVFKVRDGGDVSVNGTVDISSDTLVLDIATADELAPEITSTFLLWQGYYGTVSGGYKSDDKSLVWFQNGRVHVTSVSVVNSSGEEVSGSMPFFNISQTKMPANPGDTIQRGDPVKDCEISFESNDVQSKFYKLMWKPNYPECSVEGSADGMIPGSGSCYVPIKEGIRSGFHGWNWMSYIKDDFPVRYLSIPGSHDSCSYGMSRIYQAWALTQEKHLTWQFRYGVRVFDLRPDEDGDIYHGSVDCDKTLIGALAELVVCIKNHPGEGVIVILSKENGSLGNYDKMIHRVLREVYSHHDCSDIFVPWYKNITMGELRNHITIMYRDDISHFDATERSHGLVRYPYLFHFPEDASILVDNLKSVDGKYTDVKFEIQDYCDDVNITKKSNYVKDNMKSAVFDTRENWVINHTSGYTGSRSSMCYNKVAETVAWDAKEYISSKDGIRSLNGSCGLGLVVMDWAGSEWADPFLGKRRDTYGRSLVSYVWQDNFFRVGRSYDYRKNDANFKFWAANNSEINWDWDSFSWKW